MCMSTTSVDRYLYQFINVEAHIIIREFRIKAAEVGVVDVFKDERGRLAL